MAETAPKRPPYLWRRLLIFILVGVPVGGMLLLLALPLVMNGNLDFEGVYTSPASLPLLVLLPPFWIVGTPPALLCGGLDARLATKSLAARWRALLTGMFGGLLTLLPIFGFYAAGTVNGPMPLLVGLAGFCAAALCSGLATLADRRRSNSSA